MFHFDEIINNDIAYDAIFIHVRRKGGKSRGKRKERRGKGKI